MFETSSGKKVGRLLRAAVPASASQPPPPPPRLSPSEQGRRPGMTGVLRLPPLSRFLFLAAALVALAAFVVGDTPPPAQAQQATPRETPLLGALTLSVGGSPVTLKRSATGGITGFRADHRTYRVTVPYDTTHVTLAPTWTAAGARGSVISLNRELVPDRVITPTFPVSSGQTVQVALAPPYDGSPNSDMLHSGTEVNFRLYRRFEDYPTHKERHQIIYNILVMRAGPNAASLSVSPSSVFEGNSAIVTVSLDYPAPLDLRFPLIVTNGTTGSADWSSQPFPNRYPNVYFGRDPDVWIRRGETQGTLGIKAWSDGVADSGESLTVALDATSLPAGGYPSNVSYAPEWSITAGATTSVQVTIIDVSGHAGPRVMVIPGKYLELLRQVHERRNDPCCADDQAYTGRWDRVLLAFGLLVEDGSLEPMTAAEAQTYADRGWTGWAETAEGLRQWEADEENAPGSPEDAASPTAVTLTLGQGDGAAAERTVGESAGQVVVTATLDTPAPEAGLSLILSAGSGGSADRNADYDLPHSIAIAAGKRSGTATIAIADDDLDEDDETVSISAYAALPGGDLTGSATLTIADDDTAGLTITPAGPLEVREGGTASYAVVLDSQPTADVTVTAASADPGAATVSPASHVFTPGAWYSPATFTVSGVADADAGDESVAVSHGITSGDPRYRAVGAGSLALSVSDTEKYADLIARIGQWRNDSCCVADPAHTGRWDRALLALGKTVADTSLLPMAASEAQTYADRGWTRWVEVAAALRELQGGAPTVERAIRDVTILHERQARQVSLNGVFSDPAGDGLTVTAGSSDNAVATAVMASNYSSLMVSPQARGTATVTVIASDGRGRTASDAFTVTVKAAPVVASPLGDVSLEEGGSRDISLAGVFSDADGDALTLSASSSNDAVVFAFVFQDTLTLLAPAEGQGTASITVTAQDTDGNAVSDAFEVSVAEAQQQPPPDSANQAPTVSSAIGDVTIVNQSGTGQVSLDGVFDDADGDSLTVTAGSSENTVASVSVASDYSSLTVSARSRGTATITVTADDGNGSTVDDAFTVTVKAAPVVASPLADISGLEVSDWREVSLSGVFRDADGDALTLTAASSDHAVAGMVLIASESRLTVAGLSEGTATVTVTARDSDGNTVSDSFDVSVAAQQQQQEPPPNQAPSVDSALSDVTIVSESGTSQVSLDGVFSDADGDSLTVTAKSSAETVATVSVAADYSSLTVSAQARGTATVTVTADDGQGGTVDDTFTVTVKAAPVVASPISDVSGLEMRTTREVSLAGVFRDADGDSLTITAASSDDGRATVSVASDGSTLTLTGVAEGTATVTVTAQDSDGNRASDAFQVEVVKRFASLIPQMYQWRNDPRYVHDKAHTDRWDRALLALGEPVEDTSLTAMTADEAQTYADRGWTRWVPVTAALRELEDG